MKFLSSFILTVVFIIHFVNANIITDIACAPVGAAGAVLYPSGSSVMLSRASDRKVRGEPLPDDYKKALQCHYSRTMLDKIRVYWGVPPLDRWTVAGHNFVFGDTAGITFGYNIFIRSGKQPLSSGLTLIRHEAMHTKQYEQRKNSLRSFGYDYFKGWCANGFSYSKIPMEKDAYATASWSKCT